jgi:hypothetical protein
VEERVEEEERKEEDERNAEEERREEEEEGLEEEEEERVGEEEGREACVIVLVREEETYKVSMGFLERRAREGEGSALIFFAERGRVWTWEEAEEEEEEEEEEDDKTDSLEGSKRMLMGWKRMVRLAVWEGRECFERKRGEEEEGEIEGEEEGKAENERASVEDVFGEDFAEEAERDRDGRPKRGGRKEEIEGGGEGREKSPSLLAIYREGEEGEGEEERWRRCDDVWSGDPGGGCCARERPSPSQSLRARSPSASSVSLSKQGTGEILMSSVMSTPSRGKDTPRSRGELRKEEGGDCLGEGEEERRGKGYWYISSSSFLGGREARLDAVGRKGLAPSNIQEGKGEQEDTRDLSGEEGGGRGYWRPEWRGRRNGRAWGWNAKE